MNKGILYAIGAYGLWGVFPIYWKLIQSVPALEIIGHRIIWTFVFLVLVLTLTKDWAVLKRASRERKTVLTFCLSALLLSINWLVYVYGVNSGFIVETSLGYFINPLVSMLLGIVFLREQLRLGQWIPVGLAFLGVVYLTVSYGALPWIALILAFSFGTYGLIRKTAPLGSLHGLTLETGLMCLLALPYLAILEATGEAAFGHQTTLTTILLLMAGVATGVPLLLFGAAARRIQLSELGFIQYIAPSTQFLIGVLIYGEDFSQDRVIGFSLIWLALLIYSLEGITNRRKEKKVNGTRSRSIAE
jgi:chloramphenicol-sensitive protein RarD